jgi:hypothetical protein
LSVLRSTFVTAVSSEACPDTRTGPDGRVPPSFGYVIETSGGVVSGVEGPAVTVTAIGIVRDVEPLVPRIETWN